MSEDFKIYCKNPKIDLLFGFVGGKPIPTKQESFKPIEMQLINEDGTEDIFNHFYAKNPDKSSILEFHQYFKNLCTNQIGENQIIMKPNLVEVILAVSLTKNRFEEVDVDNLAKTLLDGMKGVIFEDDVQISSLIVNKYVHPLNTNGLLVGITKLGEKNKGFGFDIRLLSELKLK